MRLRNILLAITCSTIGLSSLTAQNNNMGFLSHVSKDSEAAFSLYKVDDWFAEICESTLGSYLKDLLLFKGSIDLDEVMEHPNAQIARAILSEEISFVLGKDAQKTLAPWLAFQEINNKSNFKQIIQSIEAGITGKEPDIAATNGMQQLLEPEIIVPLLKEIDLPPLMLTFKISDGEKRGQIYGMASMFFGQMIQQMGPDGMGLGERVEKEVNGASLFGIDISGDKLVKQMGSMIKQTLSNIINDEKEIEEILTSLQKRTFSLVLGKKEEYLMVCLGKSAESIPLADSIETSISKQESLAFAKNYLDKKLLYIGYFSQELLEVLGNQSGLASIAEGIKEGLDESDMFGDTRDIEVLLQTLATKEKELYALYEYPDLCAVLYREDGLKCETQGGSNYADCDFSSKQILQGLQKQNPAIYMHGTSNDKFMSLCKDMVACGSEATYLALQKISESDDLPDEMKEHAKTFKKWDKHVLELTKEVWQALSSDLQDGLSNEDAILIDLKGNIPAISDIPEALVKEGKMPRIALISPIIDKQKVSDSWKKTNSAIQKVLKKLEEEKEFKPPFNEPTSSEKDGLTTWSYPLPIFTDNFNPSVTSNDEIWIASTSKSYSQEIAAVALSTPEANPTATFNIDFTQFQKWAEDIIALLDEEGEEILDKDYEKFEENKDDIEGFVTALKGLKFYNYKVWKEGETLRSSFHFKAD